MGKASRTVEKQERQIEALQSQVGEINETGRFTKAKVGTILRVRVFFQLRAEQSVFQSGHLKRPRYAVCYLFKMLKRVPSIAFQKYGPRFVI